MFLLLDTIEGVLPVKRKVRNLNATFKPLRKTCKRLRQLFANLANKTKLFRWDEFLIFLHRKLTGYRPTLRQTPTPSSGLNSCKGCVYTGGNAHHCKHSVILKVHGCNRLFANLAAKTLRKCCFFLDKFLPALYHSFGWWYDCLAPKLCAICALNTSMGVYHHEFRKVCGKCPPPFQGQVVHKGAGLLPRTLRYILQHSIQSFLSKTSFSPLTFDT